MTLFFGYDGEGDQNDDTTISDDVEFVVGVILFFVCFVMTSEGMQTMIKRGSIMVLVCALAVGGYFVYDMMTHSSSDEVVSDEWDDRDNLDEFLASQTGTAIMSGSIPGQTGSAVGSGGMLVKEGEVVSNIVVGSGNASGASGEVILSGDAMGSGDTSLSGTKQERVAEIFEELLAQSSLSGQDMLSGSMDDEGADFRDGVVEGGDGGEDSGTGVGGMGVALGASGMSGHTTSSPVGGVSGGSGGGEGSGMHEQIDTRVISGSHNHSLLTGMVDRAMQPSESQAVTGVQTQSGSLPLTLPISDDVLMDHYRQRKNNNR